MALRLTKTSKVIFAISIVVLSGALGYLVWRVNQPDTVAPTESEAGGGAGACCDPNVGCVAGWKCVEKSCDETEGAIPAPGLNECGQDYRCRYLPNVTCIDPVNHICRVVTTHTCVADDSGEPPEEGECKDVVCEWPEVLMSGRIDASEDVCRCETCTGVDPSDPYSCSGNPPTCDPGNCPSGYEECGDSSSHEGGDCTKFSSLSCVSYHPDCHNPTYVYGYCKPIATQTNVCDSGTWVTRPTGNIDYEQDILFSATATDSDGINSGSITAKLCTGTVSVCSTGQSISYTVTNTTTTSATFGATLSNATNRLTPGTYTLSLTWADSLGATSASCALTTTFTLLEEETNPNWDISKSVVESCIDEGTEDPTAQLVYTIVVSNTGDGTGSISRIEDVLDTKVLAGFVQPGITTPGVFTSGKIIWDYSSPNLEIAAGGSRTYTYTLNIDKDSFGTYNNTVTLTPVGSDSISASASIAADCEIKEPEEPEEPEDTIPETGIFDSTAGRISVGLMLVILGVIVYSMPNSVFRIQIKENSYKYRERFEKKVAKK